MGIVRIYVVSRFYAYERMKEFYFGGVHSVGGLSTLSAAGFWAGRLGWARNNA
jgi:hypothetical protein